MNQPFSLKAFFIECSGPHWVAAIGILARHQRWRPILWTGERRLCASMRREYPEMHAGVGVDLARGHEFPTLHHRAPLDAQLLTDLSSIETMSLAMMGRMDPDGISFSYDERRNLYLKLVSYWLGVLRHLRPDVVVFSMTPHIVYDYVLYGLCGRFGIPTVMYDRTAFPGFLFPMSRFEDGSPELRAAYKGYLEGGHPELPINIARQLAAQSGSTKGASANFDLKMQIYAMNRGRWRRSAANLRREVFRFMLSLKTLRAPESYAKAHGKPISHGPSLWEWQHARIRGLLKKRRLSRLWNRLAGAPDDVERYVYFPLHYQPERATLPSAGMWHDQYTAIAALAAHLPAGWKLVIREHPWQLAWSSKGEMGRAESFYLSLAELDRVILAPASVSADPLLERAAAVATMTGSLGWQAVCQGKPIILFGDPWYRDVDGAFRVHTVDQLRSALDIIGAGFRPNPRAPSALAAAVLKVGVNASLEPQIEAVTGLDPSVTGENLANDLASYVRRTAVSDAY